MAIVSDQGLIVAESRYPNLIGQHFQQVLPDTWRPATDSIQKANDARLDDNGMMIVTAPIHRPHRQTRSMMLKIDKQIVCGRRPNSRPRWTRRANEACCSRSAPGSSYRYSQ